MESNYHKIFTGNSMLGKRISTELQDLGITPILKNEGESARLAGFGILDNQSVDLYVHKDEMQKALKVVQGFSDEKK
jgi:hypothetical protein